jgi:hypothetical protein
MDETTAWDDIPTLPIAPQQELSRNALRSIALAPPVLPHSTLTLMDAHNNIDTMAL